MTLQEFLDALRPNTESPLVFDTGHEVVPPGYHVTEIKQVEVRSMDCGGRANAWRETVVQVWPPARPEGAPMAVGTFLSIYERVAASLGVDASSHLRVEYGAQGTTAVAYLVEEVIADEGALRVRLAAPAVACKGRDRSVGDLPAVRAGDAPGSAEGGTSGGLHMLADEHEVALGACCAPTATQGEDTLSACCG